jgi:protein-disulfide isomerase
MRRIHAPIGLCSLLFALSVPATATAQASEQELRDDIEALKQGQEQIRKDLDEIKKLLRTRVQPQGPPAPDVAGKVFDLGDNPLKGERTAPLTLVEFTDYQ